MLPDSTAPPDVAGADALDLTDALEALRVNHDVRVSYYRLWSAAIGGHIPTVRVGKRRRVRRADLPTIAASFSAQAAA